MLEMLKCGGGGYLRMEEIWCLSVSKHGVYKIHEYKIQKYVTKISFCFQGSTSTSEKKNAKFKISYLQITV